MNIRNLMALVALSPAAAAAQPTQESASPPVQDNSFLIEEAYNQERGIVQHIGIFRRHRGTSDFESAFTQEWPVGGITHQLSYDLPLVRSGNETGLGDIRINYRYQLTGSGATQLAISPRFSVVLPTGDWKGGRGNGAAGIETMIPLSYVLSPDFTTHINAGLAYTPSARNTSGQRAGIAALTLGHSLIVTAHPRLQLLVETLYNRDQVVTGTDRTQWADDLVISPGVRAAFNFVSGLQIVPGVAIPIGVGPSSGDRSVFLYLSLEHPFARTSEDLRMSGRGK